MSKPDSRRLMLHQILIDSLGTTGEQESRVYFQPPSTVEMKYPCIVYKRSELGKKAADDQLYGYVIGYLVTVIDPDPDSKIPNKILALPMSRWVRHYTSDNLNHDVYNLFF